MGFSVSGSAAIIFLGFLAAFGMIYTSASNGVEKVDSASQDVNENLLEQQNTDIEVTNTTFSNNDTLHIYVNNTGTTTLSVEDTDILVDNTYLTGFDYQNVDGKSATDVWLPGERLHVKYTYSTNQSSPPGRVKVVTGTGIAAAEVI